MISMRKFRLEPKNLRFVQDKNDKAPWLFLLEARKGAKPFLKIDRPFVLKNDDGFTDELLSVYGRYKSK
jgi:tRNA1(Val) A37 N6-methylase TrmN6